jgi:hypothetical protein
MLEAVARLLGLDSPSSESSSLSRVRGFNSNLEYVHATGSIPEHLIVHGENTYGGRSEPVVTTVNPQPLLTDFSTNVGQLPNNVLGVVMTEQLGHVFDGKIVVFPTEDPNRVDAVYSTSKPTDWLNKGRFHLELEHHADAKRVMDPMLQAACVYGHQIAGQTYPSIQCISEGIINDNLELQRQLHGNQAPGRYVVVSPPEAEGRL